MKKLTNFLLMIILVSFTGCFESETENDFEDAGERIEETGEEAGDKVEDAADDLD